MTVRMKMVQTPTVVPFISSFCFPLFRQTFICITILPRGARGNSSMKNANHIFSRQGFTAGHGCFNFPRAHQGNIRPSSHRAAFTEQIRPHPLAVFLPRQTFKHPSNPPLPHPDLPNAQSNPRTGMWRPRGDRLAPNILSKCPTHSLCIQTLLTLNRPTTSACRDWPHF